MFFNKPNKDNEEIFKKYWSIFYQYAYLMTCDESLSNTIAKEAIEAINKQQKDKYNKFEKLWAFKICDTEFQKIINNLNKKNIQSMFLDHLEINDRKIIIFRDYFELTYLEISNILGITEDNVSYKVNSIRLKLIESNPDKFYFSSTDGAQGL